MIDYNEVVFVLQSESSSDINVYHVKQSYLAKLRSIGFLNSIRYNQAKHIQYSGAKLANYSINPFQLVKDNDKDCSSNGLIIKRLESKLFNFQKRSVEKGCCVENHDLFLIRHIFMSTYHTLDKNIKKVYTIENFDIEKINECNRRCEHATSTK
jgi:hypothetical protein